MILGEFFVNLLIPYQAIYTLQRENYLNKVASEAAIIMSDSRHGLFRKCKLKSASFKEAPVLHCIRSRGQNGEDWSKVQQPL